MKAFTILFPLAFMASSQAWCGQISLNSSNVAGGSATYSGDWNGTGSNTSGFFNATHIFDVPTGAIPADFPYWRCSGCGGPYIFIDLKAPYVITSVELFNSYTGASNVGTTEFDLVAGNSEIWSAGESGYKLTGATTTILTHGLGTELTGQTFSVSDTGSYQYLEFRPTAMPAGAYAYGLSQMRLFDNATVPEPASFGLMGLGFTAGLFVWRRRRSHN